MLLQCHSEITDRKETKNSRTNVTIVAAKLLGTNAFIAVHQIHTSCIPIDQLALRLARCSIQKAIVDVCCLNWTLGGGEEGVHGTKGKVENKRYCWYRIVENDCKKSLFLHIHAA